MSAVVDVTLAAWALLELGVRVGESFRGKGRRRRDRGTRILVALTVGAAIAVCVVLLLPALARRIHVEEAELDHVLGEAYRTYASTTTARLIPWLW